VEEHDREAQRDEEPERADPARLPTACFVPVAIEALRDPDRRFVRRGTNAWWGWGVSLYVMGFGLATQVQQIAELWIDS